MRHSFAPSLPCGGLWWAFSRSLVNIDGTTHISRIVWIDYSRKRIRVSRTIRLAMGVFLQDNARAVLVSSRFLFDDTSFQVKASPIECELFPKLDDTIAQHKNLMLIGTALLSKGGGALESNSEICLRVQEAYSEVLKIGPSDSDGARRLEWIQLILGAGSGSTESNESNADHVSRIAKDMFRLLRESKLPGLLGEGQYTHTAAQLKSLQFFETNSDLVSKLIPALDEFEKQLKEWRQRGYSVRTNLRFSLFRKPVLTFPPGYVLAAICALTSGDTSGNLMRIMKPNDFAIGRNLSDSHEDVSALKTVLSPETPQVGVPVDGDFILQTVGFLIEILTAKGQSDKPKSSWISFLGKQVKSIFSFGSNPVDTQSPAQTSCLWKDTLRDHSRLFNALMVAGMYAPEVSEEQKMLEEAARLPGELFIRYMLQKMESRQAVASKDKGVAEVTGTSVDLESRFKLAFEAAEESSILHRWGNVNERRSLKNVPLQVHACLSTGTEAEKKALEKTVKNMRAMKEVRQFEKVKTPIMAVLLFSLVGLAALR